MMFHQSKRSSLASVSVIDRFEFGNTREDAVRALLENSFPYSKKLSGHSSCVNALAFSTGDGRFLASGGDDMQIQIWDFHQDNVNVPSCSFRGPRGNIFSLEFSATNRYLYSGGTDETVLKYDISHFGSYLDATSVRSPLQTFREHEDTIRGISCHPYQDEIFLSVSQDGRILRHDGRTSLRRLRSQDSIQVAAEVTGIQFHPIMDNIFVTSDGRGVVCLRDVRMAFGPLRTRTREGIVQVYNTKLAKRGSDILSNPEASSVTFDRDGTKLAVTMLHHLPTIYALSDPIPIAVCSGKNRPGGTPVPPSERTYSNGCTIKHGSFGGPGLDCDGFYSAGSEDFCAYVWKIPRLSELIGRRLEVSPSSWVTDESPSSVGFTNGFRNPRYVPVELDTPTFRLTGHKSIVNSTLIHPHFLHILTSGIEKDILLHSPTAISPCSNDMQLTSTDVRALSGDDDEDRTIYFRALTGHHEPDSMDNDEDSETVTVRMFDHILREEGQVDLFETRRWSDDSSDDEEGDSLDDITFET
ncbi:WD40 repeat-like protein [Collybia nuda]|uniref:WD40 repeat-like protein n=1 Tax=Collybia nuda TaxID=64659 RepID=A0A9P5YA44_9AGAR|nr:WD40 repeat-like protein [Collybia nuda]